MTIIPAIDLLDGQAVRLQKGDYERKTVYNKNPLEEARKFKAFNFDYVTFSGAFSKRNDKHLKKHSGLLTIDFDHIVIFPHSRKN
jgi:phosphoribosylformimino-5-aminoimidazole carboxamide ribonucleotide (ProFAR) isomerase